ncbi:MAG: response regulator [Hyphomicrobiales bacterium]
MSSNDHIIICDDEPDIREMISEYLERQGFATSTAQDGVELRAIIDDIEPSVVVLDINMPGEDGLSLARFLRERGGTAIIMLTAAGEVVDRIIGLEMGADDYMAKPVDLRELLARIRAVLRRSTATPTPEKSDTNGAAVRIGRCNLDLEAHKLFDEEQKEVPITAMEYSLLKVFCAHANRVLNRDQLLELAHDRDWDPYDRSIDIRISRLRKKIEHDPTKPEVIKTVRGVGYIFSTTD